MIGDHPSQPCWNLFACQLSRTLENRGFRLGQLDDRAGIHRQKVSRLQKSMTDTRYGYPVLRPDELNRVQQAFDLDIHERLRLRGAVLATAIQEELVNHGIDDENARLAAYELYPVIVRALEEFRAAGKKVGTDSYITRTSSNGETIMAEQLDMKLAGALRMIDQANKYLYLENIDLERDRKVRVQQASQCFTQALEELDSLDEETQATEMWQAWHTEAIEGQNQAEKLLVEFED
jgi:hypothetical protein